MLALESGLMVTHHFSLLLTFTKIACTCFCAQRTSMHKETSSKDNAGYGSPDFNPSTIPAAKERNSTKLSPFLFLFFPSPTALIYLLDLWLKDKIKPVICANPHYLPLNTQTNKLTYPSPAPENHHAGRTFSARGMLGQQRTQLPNITG